MEKIINLENSAQEEFNNYRVRNTVRAVIFDNENSIALMNVSKDNFHKLPGGGINEGETKEEALKRECLEEAGVNIEIISELGLISEIKKTSETIQNSYCYTAKVVGEKGESDFTEKEKAKGFEIK
jgi:ADP-ribose pyrophosphatase YjhB (NUDIX family)